MKNTTPKLLFNLTLLSLSLGLAIFMISPLRSIQKLEPQRFHYSAEALPKDIFEKMQTQSIALLHHGSAYLHEPKNWRLLGRGTSNFKGSESNRVFNIDKGRAITTENILLFPSESYSFNEKLGNKELQYADGWKSALGIFQAENLERIPGGGICQVSSTLYRATLDAGLKIDTIKNHSLWVTYYAEKSAQSGLQGPGLDATIFPGKQDFRFHNSFESPILIRNEKQGEELIVEIWGYEKPKQARFIGPYTKSTLPEIYAKELSPLGLGELVYLHESPEGKEWIRHRYYQIIPQRLPVETKESTGGWPGL